MIRFWLTLLFFLSTTPAFAAGPYFWAAPNGTNTLTGADAFCETIDSTDTTTDPGVYGTVKAAALCKKFSGLGGIILKGSLGRYSGANHRLSMGSLGATAMVSGTGESTRTYIIGAPGEAVPILDLTEFYIQGNSVGTQRDWTTIDGLYLHGCSVATTPCTDTSGVNAVINFYGDHNRVTNTTCVDAWNVCIITSTYAPGGIVAEFNEIINNVGINFGRDGAGLLVYDQGKNTLVSRNECVSGRSGCIQGHNGTSGASSDNLVVQYNYAHGLLPITQAGFFQGKCTGLGQLDGRNAWAHHNVVDLRSCLANGGIVGQGVYVAGDPQVYALRFDHNTVFGAIGQTMQFEASTGTSVVSNNILLEASSPDGNQCSTQIKLVNAPTVNLNNNRCTGSISDFLVSYTSPWLKPGSAAIAAGTAVPPTGIACNGVCSQGAFQPFTYASATINETFLDVTLGMNLFTPVQNIVAAQWTVGCTGGVNCGTPVVVTATKLTGTDSVVRLSLSGLGGGGVCEVGQTWTVSATATAATDSALIGGTAPGGSGGLNQPITAFTASAVTNDCGTAPPAEPGTPDIHYLNDENTGTSIADQEPVTGGDQPGTLTGGPTWTTGKHNFAVAFANDTTDRYVAIPYGSGVNPSTQSLTVCGASKPDAGLETAQKVVFSTVNGTNQRFYVGWRSGHWGIGIQSSGFGTTSQFPVVADTWAHWCLLANSGTDKATLCINGVCGTTEDGTANAMVKPYTSYTFAANMRLGNDGTNTINYGGHATDYLKVWVSLLTAQEILDEYNNWEPPSPPSGITLAQEAGQLRLLRQTAGGLIDTYGALNAVMPVCAGCAVILDLQTNATVAAGEVAQRLRYNVDGGPFDNTVPGEFTPDGVAFYGSAAAADPDILKGAVTTLLTGALTKIDGTTNWTADAVPVVPFTIDSSTVQRSILRFDTSAVNKTICFKHYTQQGEAYSAYTPTAGACVNVVPMSAGSGF